MNRELTSDSNSSCLSSQRSVSLRSIEKFEFVTLPMGESVASCRGQQRGKIAPIDSFQIFKEIRQAGERRDSRFGHRHESEDQPKGASFTGTLDALQHAIGVALYEMDNLRDIVEVDGKWIQHRRTEALKARS